MELLCGKDADQLEASVLTIFLLGEFNILLSWHDDLDDHQVVLLGF